MDERKYDPDGFMLVSELQRCPYFEKNPSARLCNTEDCFYCKYSDFRKQEYINNMMEHTIKGVLYSVCHNVKNQNPLVESGKA